MTHNPPPELTVDPDSVLVPPIPKPISTDSAVSPSPSDPWIEPIVSTKLENGKTVKAVVGSRYGDRRRGNTTWV